MIIVTYKNPRDLRIHEESKHVQRSSAQLSTRSIFYVILQDTEMKKEDVTEEEFMKQDPLELVKTEMIEFRILFSRTKS